MMKLSENTLVITQPMPLLSVCHVSPSSPQQSQLPLTAWPSGDLSAFAPYDACVHGGLNGSGTLPKSNSMVVDVPPSMELACLPLAAASAMQNVSEAALLKWRSILLYGYELPAPTSQSSSELTGSGPDDSSGHRSTSPHSLSRRHSAPAPPAVVQNGSSLAIPTAQPSLDRTMSATTEVALKRERRAGVSAPRKSKRTSQYRGVTLHGQTGRFESHLWFKKQLYLGGFNDDEAAARVYDKACLALKGAKAVTNFPKEEYDIEEIESLKSLSTTQELVATLRRQSTCFTRGTSKYRGVTLHKTKRNRWEARLGLFSERKYKYLGCFNTQEEAAQAYDRACIEARGQKAITNFPLSEYSEFIEQLRMRGAYKESSSDVSEPDSKA